jgi:hypothetical protein
VSPLKGQCRAGSSDVTGPVTYFKGDVKQNDCEESCDAV